MFDKPTRSRAVAMLLLLQAGAALGVSPELNDAVEADPEMRPVSEVMRVALDTPGEHK